MTMTPKERARAWIQLQADYPMNSCMGSNACDQGEGCSCANDIADIIRAAEQEAALQARAEADAKWATELGKLLADGEQVAEQRGAERERDNLYDILRDQWGFSIGNTERLIKALIERAKQTEPA